MINKISIANPVNFRTNNATKSSSRKSENRHTTTENSNKKAVVVGSAVAGAALIATAIVFRKQISKFFKGLFKGNETPAGYSKEFRKARTEEYEKVFKDYDGDKVVEELKNGKKLDELGLNSRDSFARKDNPELVKKQEAYMSEEAKAARQSRLAEIRSRIKPLQ